MTLILLSRIDGAAWEAMGPLPLDEVAQWSRWTYDAVYVTVESSREDYGVTVPSWMVRP